MKKRSECNCGCHNDSGIVHLIPCCMPDDFFEQTEMKHIEIWMEGYAINGGSSDAQMIWEGEAEDFDDAVAKYSATRPAEEVEKYGPRRYTRGNFISEEAYNNRRAEWQIWGCALYDNEQDARKSFG